MENDPISIRQKKYQLYLTYQDLYNSCKKYPTPQLESVKIDYEQSRIEYNKAVEKELQFRNTDSNYILYRAILFCEQQFCDTIEKLAVEGNPKASNDLHIYQNRLNEAKQNYFNCVSEINKKLQN